MKLIEIAKQIDKSKNNEDWIDIGRVSEEFNLNIDFISQDRLKAYWIGSWCCTDTCVGYKMYFLDDEPVCISIQTGRKSRENFKWFSNQHAIKVRDYLITLMFNKDLEDDFPLCDINEDFGDSYKIEFNANIVNSNRATYKNEPVTILERILETPNYGIDTRLKIQLNNNEIIEVDITDLDFKYNLVAE